MSKKIKKFKSEKQEKEFWENHDSTQYIDWNSAQYAIFPNLKPSLKTISIRMPEWLIDNLKVLGNQRDIPYQSLIKQFLYERVNQEIQEN